ncbi:MAG: hypothetical protein P9X27_05405 [Candidatus Kaelpia aquatica]|nr:hypothetical protein [Candidatus Kaelpia aquatica]
MRISNRGYFLLDAVLATLILSILLSAVLVSLQTSIRGFRKVNESLYGHYLAEDVIYYKLLLEDNFENQGKKNTTYGEFSWLIKEDKDQLGDLKIIDVSVVKNMKICSKLSSLGFK